MLEMVSEDIISAKKFNKKRHIFIPSKGEVSKYLIRRALFSETVCICKYVCVCVVL